jgi:hypothetical protein
MLVRVSKRYEMDRIQNPHESRVKLVDVHLTHPVLRMLDDANAKELLRIERLYKKYLSAFQTAVAKIDAFIFHVKEKNTQFEQGKDGKNLKIFSDYYLKSFWNFVQIGYEAATLVQSFSRLVDGLKPLPLPKSSGRCCETVLIFQRELRAHHAKQLDRYESTLPLKKKICVIVQAYETFFKEALNQVGRYQQNAANDGFPLYFLRHSFSKYQIPCIEAYEQREEKRVVTYTGMRSCGKPVHKLKKNRREVSIEK